MRVLRFDQLEFLNEVDLAIEDGLRRIMVQAPTGYGKTIAAIALLRRAVEQKKRVMFVVPAINLVNQTVERLQQEGLDEIGVMQAYHEMTHWGMPIQVCSVQTLMRRKFPVADLVIIDEGHLWFRFYEKWFLDKEWSDVPFVAMSATPWTKGLGAWYQRLIIAGTIGEMIDQGVLSPFKVYAPSHPDLSKVRTLAGDYREDDLEEAMKQDHLIADIVQTWKDKGENRPTFCFCVNRAHAAMVQAQFNAAGVKAGYQDAFTKDDARTKLKIDFHNGDIQVVCSVGTMIVGIDWDVRCIIWARPTKSEMLFVQGTGRGLRTAEGKDYCLILDHSDNHLRLGFVTDIHHDTLNTGTKQVTQSVAAVRLPKECPECAFLKPPKMLECPSCGFKAKPVIDIEVKPGELKLLTKKKKQGDLFDKDLALAGFYWWANYRGYNAGWAKNKYREMFGEWPTSVPAPREPTMELMKWIKHRQIAWAKSRFRAEAVK